jgi:hypothetical protein
MSRSDAVSDTAIDAAPPSASRRNTLKTLAALLAEVGLFSTPLMAAAQTLAQTGTSVPTPDGHPGSIDSQTFLAVSKAITGHGELNPVTASRIFSAMRELDPAFAGHTAALGTLARGNLAPAALLDAATPLGLRDTALAIVAAWYTGTVGKGPRARLISYREALMYWPVRDALTVPTYCSFGPLWWTAPVPPVGVSAPRQTPTPTPPGPAVNRNA